jgi:hypothetical protein
VHRPDEAIEWRIALWEGRCGKGEEKEYGDSKGEERTGMRVVAAVLLERRLQLCIGQGTRLLGLLEVLLDLGDLVGLGRILILCERLVQGGKRHAIVCLLLADLSTKLL